MASVFLRRAFCCHNVGKTKYQKLFSRHISRNVVQVTEEISNALRRGNPVVALESTIITHGMPYPHNFRTAQLAEGIIRDNGVIPATIAIIGGKVKVGLSVDELELLSRGDKPCIKTSRRDLSYVISQGLNGGTTVSGTMVVAHQVGIPVFVTGGVGGVHRGAETTMDISADLTELGRTPITVVSAGVKSILDIGRTLEYLETEGVCVATYGTSKNFPAFFVSSSGYQSPFNVKNEKEAARMIDTHYSLGLDSGVLIAVPIPEESSAEGEKIDTAIQAVLEEARDKGIKGKNVTPYILERVNETTMGSSLAANIALVENNADVGSKIARELADLRKDQTSSSQYWSMSKPSYNGRIVVVGGTIVDYYAKVSDKDFELNGATYPGSVRQSFGGVGRNLADCLSRLGDDPLFVSATGADTNRDALEAHCSHMDLSAVASLDNFNTATYCAVLRNGGELLFGIGDMDVHNQITPELVSKFESSLMSAPLVVLDGNIPVDSIEYVCEICHRNKVPVWFEPTDVHKATKPFMTSAGQRLTYISPNLNELRAIYRHLTNTLESHIGHTEPDASPLEGVLDETLWLSKVIVEEVPVVMVTLGKHGVMLCQRTGMSDLPTKGYRIEKTDTMTADIFPAFNPDHPPDRIVSVSGAGDCLAATMIHGIVQGHDPDLCIKAGLMAAQMSLRSYTPVPASITPERVTLDKVKQWAPWKPNRMNPK